MTEPTTPFDRPASDGPASEDAAPGGPNPQPASGPSAARGDATIRLDDFLKRRAAVGTGGEAKIRIQGGEVWVNGEIETRRRRQLVAADRVEVHEVELIVEASETRGRV